MNMYNVTTVRLAELLVISNVMLKVLLVNNDVRFNISFFDSLKIK